MAWNEWVIVPSEEQSSVEKNATPTNPSLRTERVVLDVTYDENTQGYPTTWDWSTMVLNDGESVRVIDKLELHCEYDEIDSQIEKLTGERDTATIDAEIWKSLYYTADASRAMKQMTLEKSEARVAELEALLESEMWGVNCKPSAPDWLTKEDRETLLRLSYSLDYVQYATSADFIRSLLARSTQKLKEPKDVN